MSQTHDTMKEREREFARWLEWVASEKNRTEEWSTEETIENSSINRATWFRWKKISKPGNMPKAAKLDEFCRSFGLDPTIPYRILGWGRPSSPPARAPEPTRPAEPDLDRQIRLIRVRLNQEPPEEERRRLERLLVRAKRQREEQRQMDEEIAEILGGTEPDPSRPDS